jgi:hypothetical protein
MNITDMVGIRRATLAAGAVSALVAGVALAGPAQAAVGASVNNGQLTIVGNGANDRIALRLAAANANILQLDVGDDGVADQSFNRNLFTDILIRAGGGNDRIRIDEVNGAFTDEAITMDGGSGNDTMDGGSGNERFLGGSGRDAVDGNRGADTGVLGSGNDTFRWDPGDGSDVVEGQSGVDTLDFNGANVAENMSLSPNGQRVRFFRNVANINMDLNDVERLDLTALGGADNFTVEDMTGTDMRRADVDLGGADGAIDNVEVNGTGGSDSLRVSADNGRVLVNGLTAQVRISGSENANDKLTVNGRGGNDEALVRSAADALIDIQLNL